MKERERGGGRGRETETETERGKRRRVKRNRLVFNIPKNTRLKRRKKEWEMKC